MNLLIRSARDGNKIWEVRLGQFGQCEQIGREAGMVCQLLCVCRNEKLSDQFNEMYVWMINMRWKQFSQKVFVVITLFMLFLLLTLHFGKYIHKLGSIYRRLDPLVWRLSGPRRIQFDCRYRIYNAWIQSIMNRFVSSEVVVKMKVG